MTRLDALPRPYVEDRVPTPREVEIAGIRRRLSLIAGRLSQNQQSIEQMTALVEAELKRLRRIGGSK